MRFINIRRCSGLAERIDTRLLAMLRTKRTWSGSESPRRYWDSCCQRVDIILYAGKMYGIQMVWNMLKLAPRNWLSLSKTSKAARDQFVGASPDLFLFPHCRFGIDNCLIELERGSAYLYILYQARRVVQFRKQLQGVVQEEPYLVDLDSFLAQVTRGDLQYHMGAITYLCRALFSDQWSSRLQISNGADFQLVSYTDVADVPVPSRAHELRPEFVAFWKRVLAPLWRDLKAVLLLKSGKKVKYDKLLADLGRGEQVCSEATHAL